MKFNPPSRSLRRTRRYGSIGFAELVNSVLRSLPRKKRVQGLPWGLMPFIIFLLIITIIIFACEKVVEIDIPESEKKIVVNGMFKADSNILIHVSKSMNILDTVRWYKLPVINDADLSITSNNELININYQDKGYYLSDDLAIQGNLYNVFIEAPPLIQVRAEIEVPERIDIISIDTSSFYGKTYTVDSGLVDILFYEARLKFKDPAEIENFYIIGCKAFYDHIDIDLDIFNLESFLDNPDLFLLYGDTVQSLVNKFVFSGEQIVVEDVWAEEGILLNDNIINGKEAEISVIFEPDKIAISQLEYYFSLISITEDYYNYIISRERAYNSNGPFSHPVQVFSNIENGYGIIAGCAESVDSVIFSKEEIDRFRYTSLDQIANYFEEEENDEFD